MSRNSEAEIRRNMDRYIDGMKANTGRDPARIHLFRDHYRALLKAENARHKEAHPSAQDLRKVADYKGIPVVELETKSGRAAK